MKYLESKNVLISLTLIIFVIKLFSFFNIYEDPNVLIYPDEINYYAKGAENFRAQGFAYFLTKRSLYNGPLNILWVALFKNNFLALKVCNLFLFSLCSLLLWSIVSRLYNKRIAFYAWVFFNAYPPFIHYSFTILSEPLYIVFLLISFYFFVKGKEGKYLKYIFLSGLIFGLATLVRPTSQYFPIFFFLLILIKNYFRKSQKYKIFIKTSSIFLFGFYLIIAPWMLKNLFFLNKLAIANGSGAVLYLGNDLKKNGDEPVYVGMVFDTGKITDSDSHLSIEGDDKLTKAAIRNIKSEPFEIFKLTLKKSFKLVFGHQNHYFFGTEYRYFFKENYDWNILLGKFSDFLTKPFIGIMFCLAVFNILTFSFSKFFLTSFALYFFLVHLVLFPIPRLFLPAIVSIICLLGVVLKDKKTLFLSLMSSALISTFIAVSSNYKTNQVSESYIDNFQQVELPYEIQSFKGLEKLSSKPEFLKLKGRKQNVVLEIPLFTTQANSVIFIEIEHSAKKGEKPTTGVLFQWKENQNDIYTKENSTYFSILRNHSSNYMISPTSSKPKWRKGTPIKTIKLTFFLKNNEKIKIKKIIYGK